MRKPLLVALTSSIAEDSDIRAFAPTPMVCLKSSDADKNKTNTTQICKIIFISSPFFKENFFRKSLLLKKQVL